MSSGSLGQGISAAVGMALSAKLRNKSYRVYTLLGDGEIRKDRFGKLQCSQEQESLTTS